MKNFEIIAKLDLMAHEFFLKFEVLKFMTHENFETNQMGFHGALNFHETLISRPLILNFMGYEFSIVPYMPKYSQCHK